MKVVSTHGQRRVLLLFPPQQRALILVAPAPGGTALLLFLIVAFLYLVFRHFFILQVCQAFCLVTFSKDSSFWSTGRCHALSPGLLALITWGSLVQCCSPGKELLNSWLFETSTKTLDRCMSKLSICILGILLLTLTLLAIFTELMAQIAYVLQFQGTGTGLPGKWSQHPACLDNTLGHMVWYLGMVLCRARSWTW